MTNEAELEKALSRYTDAHEFCDHDGCSEASDEAAYQVIRKAASERLSQIKALPEDKAKALAELEAAIAQPGSCPAEEHINWHLSPLAKDTIRAALSAQPVAPEVTELERAYGPIYYIENTIKLLRDIDENQGLCEGGEQYPNALCCLDNADQLEKGLKEMRALLSRAGQPVAVPDPVTGLKPCPFCGSNAEFEEISAGPDAVNFSVGCSNSKCLCYQTFDQFSRRTDAATAWNTRATQPDAAKDGGAS